MSLMSKIPWKTIGVRAGKITLEVIELGAQALVVKTAGIAYQTVRHNGFSALKNMKFDDVIGTKKVTVKRNKMKFKAKKKETTDEARDNVIDAEWEDVVEYDMDDNTAKTEKVKAE